VVNNLDRAVAELEEVIYDAKDKGLLEEIPKEFNEVYSGLYKSSQEPNTEDVYIGDVWKFTDSIEKFKHSSLSSGKKLKFTETSLESVKKYLTEKASHDLDYKRQENYLKKFISKIKNPDPPSLYGNLKDLIEDIGDDQLKIGALETDNGGVKTEFVPSYFESSSSINDYFDNMGKQKARKQSQ
jgi:translation elongation factor EF-G